MFTRTLGLLLALAAALVAVVLTWPQLLGLQDQFGFAHVVAFRGAVVAVAVVVSVVLLVLLTVRILRPVIAALLVITVLFGVANGAILLTRGFGQRQTVAAGANAITVLSWNTFGGNPGADAVAQLALEHHADVVALPETTDEFATEVAEKMRAGGRPMWAHGLSFSEVYKARSTALLISPDLGEYTVESAGGTGPPGNTNVSPTVVARPADGTGPTLIAVHAVSPLQGEMLNWRSDLDWLAEQCAGGDVIMAGDFNATIDHMAGRGTDGGVLGGCSDAAQSAGAAAVGTWPSDLPAVVGAPIDHVMATANWSATSFSVITSLDRLGSDHRPIVATLTRR